MLRVMSRVLSIQAVALLALAISASAAAQPAPKPDVADTVSESGSEPDGENDSEGTDGRLAFGESDEDYDDEDEGLDKGEVIVVTGSRVEQKLAATTVSTEVITRNEIVESGAQSVSELLEQHPGIQLVDGLQGSSVQIQGLDPSYVLILVDGKRVIGRVFGAIDLERYNVENIERIEVVKGASSAMYGSDALAGVINIITRKAKKPIEGEVTTQYGNYGTLHTTALTGLVWRGFDTRFSAGYHRGDGFDLDPESVHTTGSQFVNWQVANQTNVEIGRLQLSGSLDYVRRDLQRVDSSIAGSDDVVDDAIAEARATLDRRSLVEIATGTLSGRYKIDKTKYVNGRVSYSYYRDQLAYDQRGSNDLDLYEETLESLTDVSLKFAGLFAKKHLITTGFDGLLEFIDSPRLRERTGDLMCDTNDPAVQCNTTGDRQRGALYIQDEYQLIRDPSLYLVPGVRFDADSQFGTYVSPKLALRWDPGPEATIRMSYGQGYRAPDFKELYLCFENINAGYYVVGNPDLTPERSHNMNFSIEQRHSKRLWTNLSLFYNTLDNLIAFQLADSQEAGSLPNCSMNLLSPYTHRNIASAFTRGAEVSVRARPNLGPLDGITLEAGYTLTDSRDRETELPLAGRAHHRGNVRIGYENRRIGFRINFRSNITGTRAFYVADPDSDGTLRVEAAPYASVNGRMEQTILKRYKLFAGVNNLLNAGDVQFLPIAPRTFYLGMRARY